jgi:hypothetical protein
LIRNLWQHKTAILVYWCLICALPLNKVIIKISDPIWCQSHKSNFFVTDNGANGRKLRISVISVCPWQASPALSSVCG